MDNETPKESSSSSSNQPHSTSKRSLAIMDEKEYSHKKKKKMSEADSFENTDDSTEAEIKKAPLQQMIARLYAEGQATVSLRREVVGIIIPIAIDKTPILIQGTVTIGKSSSCDIDLTKYGPCENVSDHHATLIYDRMLRVFELLNYGRTGTKVDHFVYSNGMSSKEPPSNWAKEIADLLASKHKKSINETSETELEDVNDSCIVHRGKIVRPCDVSQNLGSSFSGYAVVKHGSTLRFGCIDFVFCSVDRR